MGPGRNTCLQEHRKGFRDPMMPINVILIHRKMMAIEMRQVILMRRLVQLLQNDQCGNVQPYRLILSLAADGKQLV